MPFVDHTSFSSISLYNTCPERWRHIHLLNEKEPPTVEQQYGLAVGKAIVHWYEFNQEPAWDSLANEFELLQFDRTYHIELVKEAYKAYTKSFQDERDSLTFLGQELPFVFILTPKHNYKTILDIALKGKNGQTFGIELKTSRYYTPMLPFDKQLIGELIGSGFDYIVRRLIYLAYDAKKRKRVPQVHGSELLALTERSKKMWLQETTLETQRIQESLDTDTWPRRAPQACYRGGQPCPFIINCDKG